MIHLHEGQEGILPEGPASRRARRAGLARNGGPVRKVARPNGGRGHPATSDVEYSQNRVRFFMLVDAYKRRHGRLYLTLNEYLDLAEEAGWRNVIPEWSSDARDDRYSKAS